MTYIPCSIQHEAFGKQEGWKTDMSVTGVIGLDNFRSMRIISSRIRYEKTEYCQLIGSFMMKKDSKNTMSERINTFRLYFCMFPSRPNIPFKKEPLSCAQEEINMFQ